MLRDRIIIEEPYMGGFIGKELRLSIVETVVRGQPPATDEERLARLDPVVGDLVSASCLPVHRHDASVCGQGSVTPQSPWHG